jgi:NAD(P)-dependent dehydrogenase (short-subunit alcohol dehydrogenase family)
MVTTPLENRWRAALAGRTAVISGGSRGIGLAIGCVLGRAGCNVALLAKTDRPHPKLEGTVHTAAAAIEQSGGRALAVVGDVRNEEDVARCVAAAAARFGGVDLVVNNASAIALQPIGELGPPTWAWASPSMRSSARTREPRSRRSAVPARSTTA